MTTVEWLIFLLFGVFVGLLLLWAGVALHTQSVCLEAGYPSAKMSVGFSRYCIKRVDQTDIVVPLAKAVAK